MSDDRAHQAEQRGRVVAGTAEGAEALAGGEGHHHQTEDQRGHRAHLEGQQRHDGHGDPGPDPQADRAPAGRPRWRRRARRRARRAGGPPPVGVAVAGSVPTAARRRVRSPAPGRRPRLPAATARWRRCPPVGRGPAVAGGRPAPSAGSPSRTALRSAAASPATPARLRPAPGTSVTDAPGGSAASGDSAAGSASSGRLGPHPGRQQSVAPGPAGAGGAGGAAASSANSSSSARRRTGAGSHRSRWGRSPDAATAAMPAAADTGPGTARRPGRPSGSSGRARRPGRSPSSAVAAARSASGSDAVSTGSVSAASSRRPRPPSLPRPSPAGAGRSGPRESRSNSQGRRSASVPSVSSSEPRATLSSAEHGRLELLVVCHPVGVLLPPCRAADPRSRPRRRRRRASTAGTWPVGGSVQWGSSVAGPVPVGTAVWPGRTGSTAGVPESAVGRLVGQADQGCSSSSSTGVGAPPAASLLGPRAEGSPGDLARPARPRRSGPGRWPDRSTAPPAPRRVTGRSLRATSILSPVLARRPRQLVPPVRRAGHGPHGVRSRGAPAPCARAGGRWRPPGRG